MDRVKKLVSAIKEEIYPYTGEGVTAAVIDSGIAMHPDLRKNLAGFRDFVGHEKRPYDDSGHGTHVAGCICGSGSCSEGKYAGMAPGCRILSCKVLDEKGEGTAEAMIEAVSFILDTQKLYGTKILNLSAGLSRFQDPATSQELNVCLEKAWQAGLLVVVAAGNTGPKPDSMSLLGKGKNVIAVGCYEKEETQNQPKSCLMYSGRGPEGAGIRKPDIVAPGSRIMSCHAAYRMQRNGRVNKPYVAMDGTSMSVPIISGAAALLWHKYPHFSNEQIRRRILWTARDLGEPWNYQGWGMLDVKRMLSGLAEEA